MHIRCIMIGMGLNPVMALHPIQEVPLHYTICNVCALKQQCIKYGLLTKTGHKMGKSQNKVTKRVKNKTEKKRIS